MASVFIYIHTLCTGAAKALASLHICADLPEPLLPENSIYKYQNLMTMLIIYFEVE